MSLNNTNSPPREGRNVWSAGSRGSRGGFTHSDNQDRGGSGSFRSNFPRGGRRGGGGYGFRQQNNNNTNDNNNDEEEIEILKDAIFIQNLPKNITRDDINEAFSTVGPIKIDERSGGPKIWIYKDRMTGEGNGRATVTYESEETAAQAISEYNDQHIPSLNSVVRVQLAQRRIRNNDNYNRGGFNNNRGYRGGRNNWNNNSGPGGNNRWNNSRGGGGGGFRGRGSYFRGNQGNSFRGGYRGTADSSY